MLLFTLLPTSDARVAMGEYLPQLALHTNCTTSARPSPLHVLERHDSDRADGLAR